MGLHLDAELLTGTYDAAAADDPRGVEWPPHPARVFCALVAGARSDRERQALRWLEAHPPPMVLAAPLSYAEGRNAYVVTNRAARGGNQTHVGRTNALRQRVHAVPQKSRFHLAWPEAEPDEETLSTLDALAARVPYLGRSTGVVLISVHTTATEECDGLQRHEPTDGAVPGTLTLRVPYAGYLDELAELFEGGRPAWEIRRTRRYAVVQGEIDAQPQSFPSPVHDFIPLRLAKFSPDGRWIAMFTEALRRRTLRETADPLPPALHGHGLDGNPHVAFLALPDVGFDHSDGHLLGLAVAIPRLPDDEVEAIVRGVLAEVSRDDELILTVPRLGDVTLRYAPDEPRPRGAAAQRWQGPARRWVSATPVILDRYPNGQDFASEIRWSCQTVGLPVPREVFVSTSPLIRGAVRVRPSDLPRQARRRLFRHVSMTFDHDLDGPVLLGAGRYLGFGLFAPVVTTPNGDGR